MTECTSAVPVHYCTVHGEAGENRTFVCRTMISLGLQKQGWIAHMPGILPGKDTGSLGKTSQDSEEG